VLRLIRSGKARTRGELAAVTGLARSTVSQRVDLLLAHDWIYEAGEGQSTGGRAPTVLAFNRNAGVVLAADLGATHAHVAVTDLDATLLAEALHPIDIGEGPDVVLPWLEDRFRHLLARVGRSERDVRGIGMGVPGPVEFATGTPVAPPIMPGWDGISVPERLRSWGVPVFVDNDVNVMALGEFQSHWQHEVGDLLFVKVATGIGCGMILGGEVHRGRVGAAGDIGHVRVAGHDDEVCRCGNVACLEAVAGGGAICKRLRQLGHEASTSPDVVRLVRAGEPDAIRLVREAGRLLGEVLASAVNMLNPAVIVIGGELAQAHEQLLAGVREIVYRRSLPLATRNLRIVRETEDLKVGVTGAALLAIESLVSQVAVDLTLARAAEFAAR
jgi:predicted NBD/HSP70 family sugar kinase